jgi:cytoskeletal protein CcmA (bactofilin family)
MWSNRKTESPSLRNIEPIAEAGSENVGGVSNLAVIGSAMVIRGDVVSSESLHIDGELSGSLELQESRLTVGPKGKVAANAKAREIEIIGSLAGNLDATKKIIIRKGARLVGDLRTPSIVIEEGAYFKGKIEIVTGVGEAAEEELARAKAAAAGD